MVVRNLPVHDILMCQHLFRQFGSRAAANLDEQRDADEDHQGDAHDDLLFARNSFQSDHLSCQFLIPGRGSGCPGNFAG